jgi:hypothetical protein
MSCIWTGDTGGRTEIRNLVHPNLSLCMPLFIGTLSESSVQDMHCAYVPDTIGKYH